MDATKKAKWVAALLGGGYEQTKGKLREVDENDQVVGYCCLGVYLDVNVPGHWEGDEFLPEGLDQGVEFGDLSRTTCDQEGLDYEHMALLCKKNDGFVPPTYTKAKNVRKASFATIAKWIERNVEVS